MLRILSSSLLLCSLVPCPLVMGQESQAAKPDRRLAATDVATASGNPRPYVLGPTDQISIWALEAEDIGQKPYRVDDQGFISVPMAGKVHVAGLTTSQTEQKLRELLKQYVKDPQVTVSIQEFRSQPISIVGAFIEAGVQNLQGRKTLLEVVSSAKGLRDDAGPTVKVTRRMEYGSIPLPGAVTDARGETSTAEIQVKELLSGAHPELNLAMRPFDIVSASRGETVYVLGEVQKAGGFVLGGRQAVTVLQALSMAGGLTRMAAPKNARVLRVVAGSAERKETPVDLREILAGKTADQPMGPDDILFVPNNVSRNVSMRTFEALINIGTGIAIFRAP